MRQKRAELWDKAKAFLDEHQNENGVMSAEDTEEYERMEQDVVDMGHAIERMERAEQMDREMNDPANPVLAGRPERPAPAADNKRGTASDAYKKAFWNSVRGRMNYDVRNALQVGEPHDPQSIPGSVSLNECISASIRIDLAMLSLSLEIGIYSGSSSKK
jgi:HK97 family phage major capsid protein